MVEINEELMDPKKGYIANQGLNFGNMYLDEIQISLGIAESGMHLALSGGPGCGKSRLANTVLPKILGLENHFHDITCERSMTEGPFVGTPNLTVRDGNTVTEYTNGVVTQAMEDAKVDGTGMVYLDEFANTRPDVQTRLNSALDNREKITRRDGASIITDGNFFFCTVSYNPSTLQDMADSTADRFMHLNFNSLSADMLAYISCLENGYDPAGYIIIEKEKRGIGVKELQERDSKSGLKRSFDFLIEKDGGWYNMFNGEEFEDGTVYAYEAVAPKKQFEGKITPEIPQMTFLKIAEVVKIAEQLNKSGTSNIEDPNLENMLSSQNIRASQIEMPSFGRLSMSLSHVYDRLLNKGMDPVDATKTVGWMIGENIARGSYQNLRVGNGDTLKSLMTLICEQKGLLPKPKLASNFQ